MSDWLYLFEHETISFPWTDQDLATIERLNQVTGTEILKVTTRNGKRALQAKEYVGIFRFGKHTIQVLPKIYWASAELDPDERARQATRNLLYLLAYAGKLPISEQAIVPLLKRNLDWFEILTHLFSIHLLEEWKKGAYRTYQTFDVDLTVLKGKWRIADQIRRPDRRHIFPVIFDEFTPDNSLNRLFRYVVERLWRLSRDSENRHNLEIIRQWMEDVALLSSMTLADAEKIQLTRLNQRYEPLLNLACLFLDDSALQLTSGAHAAFVFVFDMNMLYEAFVSNFIKRNRKEILQENLSHCDILPQTRGATRFLATQNNRRLFRLKPDLAFRSGNTFPLLLDTKYKRLNQADARLGISQADFYQMYAYARRYQSPRVLLLYPQMVDMPKPLQAHFQLEEEGQLICVETLDLHEDLGSPAGKQSIISQLRKILGEGI